MRYKEKSRGHRILGHGLCPKILAMLNPIKKWGKEALHDPILSTQVVCEVLG